PPVLDVPLVDVAAIFAEDAAATTGRLREGVAVPLDFDPAMGLWLDVPGAAADGGGWLWVLDVRAQGAFGVRPHFKDFALPAGARAIVYDPRAADNLPAPYQDRGPLGRAEFWAWTCWRDTARVEVYFPRSVGEKRFGRCFTIDQAIRMYRDPDAGLAGMTNELPCHIDLE